MEDVKQKYTRKNFMIWGVGILASVSFLKFAFTPKKNKNTVKMLSQDGKLVEVDMSLLQSKKRKVTSEELQTWVKK